MIEASPRMEKMVLANIEQMCYIKATRGRN